MCITDPDAEYEEKKDKDLEDSLPHCCGSPAKKEDVEHRYS